MSAPYDPTIAQPLDAPFIPQASTADFGPDHTAAPADTIPDEKPKPKPRNGNKPASNGSPLKDTFFSLGKNKKLRSPVRRLTEEDHKAIVSLYTYGAMGLMLFHEEAAVATAESAEACADAWMDLAAENDQVRRVILALIEGGVWGKLFAAHAPIFKVVFPDLVPKLFRMATRRQEEPAS